MISAQDIKDLAAQYHAEVIKIRRHLHKHPELSFQEEKTAAYIARELEAIGIPFREKVGGNGIVATIAGLHPDRMLIALRADFDALPIQETNTCEYASANAGVMHACGHDAHTAMLLGVAKILNSLRTKFSGSVRLIFQPAEEKLPGGASLMIADGALENPKVEAIIGQHVYPDLEAGMAGFRPGMYMASTDELYFSIKGAGGHAALPHKVVDTVLIASHIVVALQQIVSRRSDPATPSVLSVGKFVANGATNVIPDVVHLEGTFRTFDETWRTEAHRLIRELAGGVARSMGGHCEVRIEKGYPFLVNDPEVTAQAVAAAKDFMLPENVAALGLRMTAEDFAWYSQKVPACFYRIGTRNSAKGITAPLHTSRFDIDEEALKTGMGLMAWIALNQLGDSPKGK